MKIECKYIFIKLRLLLLLLLIISPVSAQFDYSSFLANTKDIRRIDNFGTDFYLTVPPAYFNENTNNITIKLFVFSYNETKVKIQVDAKAFTETAIVFANTETVFDILPEIAFPFSVTSTLPLSNEEIYKKSALRVTSDYPVAVYVLISGNLQSEGYLGLPVSSAGKEYVLQSYIDPTSQIASPINYPAMAGIVNPFDGNKISVILSDNLKGKVFPRDTVTRVLDQGDTWFISLKGKIGDLTGVKVISDKPISVITANQFASVPVGTLPNNYLTEQEIPTYTWGNYYQIPRLVSRSYNPIIKVVAKEPNTDIYLNGQLYTTLITAGNLNEFVEIRPNVTIPKGLEVISSNKKIAVSVFHPGYGDEQANSDFFKPCRVNLVPYEQYANSILFNVSRHLTNIEKTDVYLYIVAQLNSDGSISDEFELGSFVNNSLVWNKVSNLSIIDQKEFKYQFNGRRFAQITIKISKSGNYKLRSNSYFAAYLFGSNEQGAFTFPAGLPQRNLLSSDFEPPVPTYIQLCDGSVQGKTVDMPDNSEIRSNLTTPIFHSVLSQNYDKTFGTIIPGITSSFEWSLNVRDKNLDAIAVITFRDYSGNDGTDTTIVIQYKAPKILIQPSLVNFGNTKIGVESTQQIKIINNSDSTYRIKDILFKYAQMGFKLKTPYIQKVLPPKGEQIVDISFIPQKTGLFEDSVGVNNDCFTAFKSKLIGRVGSPKIMVTDVFFSDITLPNSETKTASITNAGENDLVITSFDLSDKVNFSIDMGRVISQAEPLIIEPNKSYNFNVIFNPKIEKSFNETITFRSDAQEIDSVCILKAKAILPGLVTTSYDWQKVRLDLSINPAEYTVSNAIIIRNTGKSDITITKVSIEPGSINTSNFKVNFAPLMGKTFKPNENFELPATFIPKSIGVSELILKFETNLSTENISKLTAIAVIPKIQTKEDLVDFDTTLVNYPSQENNRLIEISNLSQIDWQFGDILTVYEIKPQDPEIVQIGEENITSSFSLQTTNIQFPVKLLPGEKLSIPASFSAKDTGLITTKLFIKSDAINDTEIQLQGYGADRLIAISNLELSNCMNMPVTGTCQIRNNSIQKIEVEKLYFDNEDIDFKIIDDISNGLTIQPTETRNITIQYTPTGLSSKTLKLYGQVKGETIPSLTAQILGKTNQYSVSSYLSPVSQTANIDEDIKAKIYIEDHPQLKDLLCDKFFVTLHFESNFLKLMENSISLGKTISGKFKIENLKINQAKGEATFELISLQSLYQINVGEFLTMEFHTYLPTDDIEIGQISASIIPSNNPCFLIQTSSSNVILNATCTGDLRRIRISANDYYLDGLKENPVNQNEDIKFGIAFNGFTEISLINQSGTLCQRPFFGDLSKGNYEFKLDITNLSTGIYFLIFKSSEYSEIRKFIIEK
jgi:hypothetical protein